MAYHSPGASLERSEVISFTPAYAEIEATYLVRGILSIVSERALRCSGVMPGRPLWRATSI